MGSKKINNEIVVIDWETGDNEGDRKYIFHAYYDFIKELLNEVNGEHHISGDDAHESIRKVIDKWKISIDNQIDDFPRIWIKRPE